jgi:hypothetical protein
VQPVDPSPPRPIAGSKIIIAEHQEGVRPLPAWVITVPNPEFLTIDVIMTRWHPTEEERRRILDGDDIWIVYFKPADMMMIPTNVATKPSELVQGWPDE